MTTSNLHNCLVGRWRAADSFPLVLVPEEWSPSRVSLSPLVCLPSVPCAARRGVSSPFLAAHGIPGFLSARDKGRDVIILTMRFLLVGKDLINLLISHNNTTQHP